MADWRRVLPYAWSLLLALLMLGPALGPGYVLSYDMVWVPDLALRPDFLGLGSGLPRAVPSDAVVAVIDELVPGMALQKLMLLSALMLGGLGATRLIDRGPLTAQLGALTLYQWNPFVAERLLIGHWPLLLTYAALPWIVAEARRLRGGDGSVGRVVLWIALGSLSPVGGVLVCFTAVVSVALAGGGGRRVVQTVVGGLLVNAPWIVAGVLQGSAARSDPVGATVFAAQGEGPLPAPLAVLGLGGIWNAEVVPVSREGWPAAVLLGVVLIVCLVGIHPWLRKEVRGVRSALLVLAAVGLAVSLAGWAVPGAVAWVGAEVPGGGLLRDGTRWVLLVALLQAPLFGLGAARLAQAVRPRLVGLGVGTLLLLAPVALAPDLAGGLSGRLRAVGFPEEYAVARAALQDAVESHPDGGGDVLLLPFSSYRAPSWNEGRRTLDPLGRYLTPDFLQSDDLYVSGRLVPGEDRRAERVGEILAEGGSPTETAALLRAEGIAWVVLDREAEASVGDAAPSLDVPQDDVLLDGKRLAVWGLPGPVRETDDDAARVTLMLAWGAAGATLVLMLAGRCTASVRRRRSRRPVRAG